MTMGARSRALSRIGRLEVVIMFDFENCEVRGHELSFNAERLLNLEIMMFESR